MLLARLLLDLAGLRKPAVKLLSSVVRGDSPERDDPLCQQMLKGVNLDRPFAEHGRPFPVVKQIEPEQALWLLGCLASEASEAPLDAVAKYLTSENWRERIDAAVVLNRFGFGRAAADILAAEAGKPYALQGNHEHRQGPFRPELPRQVLPGHGPGPP